MDHKREHQTPPTSKGYGSGLTTTVQMWSVYGKGNDEVKKGA